MKNLIISFLCSLMMLMIAVQSLSKPYQPQVKGNFKSFTTTEYRYEPGKKNPKSVEIINNTILDNYGNCIEMISYENGKPGNSMKIENLYNEKGLLTGTNYFDLKGKLNTKYRYNYDDKNNMVNDTTINQFDEILQIGTYFYDNNNFLIQETHKVRIDKNEYSSGTTYFKNDKFGNRIEEFANRSSSIEMSVDTKTDLEDSNKNTSNVSINSSNSESSIKYKYTYDKNNNIIKEIRISFDNFKFIREYKYDDFGNITETLYPDDNGKIILRIVNQYKN